jgi:hypothetical protein
MKRKPQGEHDCERRHVNADDLDPTEHVLTARPRAPPEVALERPGECGDERAEGRKDRGNPRRQRPASWYIGIGVPLRFVHAVEILIRETREVMTEPSWSITPPPGALGYTIGFITSGLALPKVTNRLVSGGLCVARTRDLSDVNAAL